jgi:arsenite methyltransferase
MARSTIRLPPGNDSLKSSSMTSARSAAAIARYRKHAPGYDASAVRTMPLRRRVVDLLRLRPGDSVLDVACGTGLSFGPIEAAIGPAGRLLGIELSPDMLDLARERVTRSGWNNVSLIESAVQDADLPFAVDAILFNYTHDVLRSPEALARIFRAAKPGARVAVAGMRRYSWWLAPLNLYVYLKAWPYMTTFEGLGRPWDLLARHVPSLRVRGVHLGTGYIAHGDFPGERASARA